MLKELKFVQGSVSRKELIPGLSHFCIENGTIRGYNGSLAISTPINLDISCKPKAIPFVKAIQNCEDTVSLSMTQAGRLSIKSGKFKAFIECIEEETPHVTPEGDYVEIDGEVLIKALATVIGFVGDDASRPWSNGVLLKGQSAYATNNVSLIEYWIGVDFPQVCNIPREAVNEMLRVKDTPVGIKMDNKSISFIYEDGKWIRSALLNTEWPDLKKVLDRQSNQSPINEELFNALPNLKPFIDKLERIYVFNGVVSTSLIEGEGALVELDDFPYEGVYQLSILSQLKGIADSIDFAAYPSPCIFYGKNLRGAIIGMRT